MTKLRGSVGAMYIPQNKVFGEIFRCLITAQFLTPPDERFGEITLSPTWQNFPIKLAGEAYGDFDLYLSELKNRNIKVMANLLNGFNKKYGLPLKALPKNAPNLSSDDMQNWTLFRNMLEQFTLRYGKVKDDSKIDIADHSLLWSGKPQAPQSKVSGLNLVWAIHILNELNNTWVKPEIDGRMSGGQYAHLLKYLTDGIWSIDPSMAVVAQCTAGWKTEWWTEFFNTWTASYGAFPNYNPETNTGIAISFNEYLSGCGFGKKCRVKNPIEAIPLIANEVNAFLKERGAYAMITEHGCATELNSDLGYPEYAGLDKYQSQAKFIVDSTNIWLSYSNIIAATFYQYEDDPNEPRFQYTGVLENNTLNEKPSYAIIKEAFAKPFVPVTIPAEPPSDPPIPPTPNPTNMKIGFSRNANRTDFREFVEGENIAAGNIYIEARDVTPTVYFTMSKDGVIIVNNKPESGAPYDAHGGQPYNAGNGTYTLFVRDKNNTLPKSVLFTVGTITPPLTKEPIIESYIENGKVFFETAIKTYSTSVQ